MALNDVDAAVESFKKALELEPNDGGLTSNLPQHAFVTGLQML